LRDVLEDAAAPIWNRIKANKELSEDILSVLKTDRRARDIDYFAAFDKFDEYVKAGGVGTSGDQIVVAAGMKAIGDLTEEDPTYPPVLARTNNDLLFAYWKRFIKKSWSQYAYILKRYPEYAETEEASGDKEAGLPGLRLGDKVEPGPTWPRWIGPATHLEVEGVTGWLISVIGISTKTGDSGKWTMRYGTDPDGERVFQDIKLPDDVAMERTKKKEPEELSIGQRVKRGPTWEWEDQDCGADGGSRVGTVTQRSDLWYTIRWDGDEREDSVYEYRYGTDARNKLYRDVVPA
jgi:hypothetical protein